MRILGKKCPLKSNWAKNDNGNVGLYTAPCDNECVFFFSRKYDRPSEDDPRYHIVDEVQRCMLCPTESGNALSVLFSMREMAMKELLGLNPEYKMYSEMKNRALEQLNKIDAYINSFNKGDLHG